MFVIKTFKISGAYPEKNLKVLRQTTLRSTEINKLTKMTKLKVQYSKTTRWMIQLEMEPKILPTDKQTQLKHFLKQ